MAKANRSKSPAVNKPNLPLPTTPSRPAPQASLRASPSAGIKPKISVPDSMFGKSYNELIFGKQNYLWGLVGVGLIALGLILMLGGGMPNPDMWDDHIIYSFRIITLAPLLIVAGLVVEIYAIFRKAD